MKIRLKDSFAIADESQRVRDVSEAKALDMIDRGLAEAVLDADEQVERHEQAETTALPDIAEKAVKRAPKKKRRGKSNVERS